MIYIMLHRFTLLSQMYIIVTPMYIMGRWPTRNTSSYYLALEVSGRRAEAPDTAACTHVGGNSVVIFCVSRFMRLVAVMWMDMLWWHCYFLRFGYAITKTFGLILVIFVELVWLHTLYDKRMILTVYKLLVGTLQCCPSD